MSFGKFLKFFPLPWRGGVTSNLVLWGDGNTLTLLGTDPSGKRITIAEPEAAAFPDAPPLGGGAARTQDGGRKFVDRLRTTARHVGREPRWLLVPDTADAYLGRNPGTKTRDVVELAGMLATGGAGEILPEFAQRGDYRWVVLDSYLRPVFGGEDPNLYIAGVPSELASAVENWAVAQGGTVFAIIPAPVAVLAWASAMLVRARIASAVFIGSMGDSVMQAIFVEGRLMHLDVQLGTHPQLEQIADHIPTSPSTVYYLWTRDGVVPSYEGINPLTGANLESFGSRLVGPARDSVPLPMGRGDYQVMAWLSED